MTPGRADRLLRVDLHVDDDAFVRAPVELVYPRLTNLAAWPEWWPGVRVASLDARRGEFYGLEWRTGWRLPLRMVAQTGGWRHHAGFEMHLTGDVIGRAEFWLETGYGGTVVHHVLAARTDRRMPMAVLRQYRRVLRQGLWAFKDTLQEEVRETAGMAP